MKKTWGWIHKNALAAVPILISLILALSGSWWLNDQRNVSSYLSLLDITYEAVLTVEQNQTTVENSATAVLVSSQYFHTKASPMGKRALLLLHYQISHLKAAWPQLRELSPNQSKEVLILYNEYLDDVRTIILLEQEKPKDYNKTIEERGKQIGIDSSGSFEINYARDKLEEFKKKWAKGEVNVFEEASRK